MAAKSKASFRRKTAVEVSRELMMESAIQATAEGLSQHAAAKQYKVSRASMRRRIANPVLKTRGGQLKLPEWAEKELADLFVSCADAGVPLNRYHSLQLMSELASELGIDGVSFGDKYFRRFISRHKDLSLRITHASNRKKDREWTEERCDEYIGKLQVLKDKGFLDKPEQAWNLDETAFDTVRMVDRVIARKGAKQIASQYDGTEKELVTILPCGNAAGLQLRFMALFSGKLHVQSRLDDTHNMCYQAVNASGYMDQLLFANYVKNEVFPAITEEKNVIFVDGHFSHVNCLLLVRYCRQFFVDTGKRVEIFCLPTGQTNHLQPFDVSVFGGIKKKWHDYLASRNVLAGGMVTKDTLCSHLVKLWFRTEGFEERFAFNAGDCLKSGFEKCGLFPFNPEVIRATVKGHHDPENISRGLRIKQEKKEDQAKLFQVLRENYAYESEADMKKAEESILLIAKGITPGMMSANALQKRLHNEAPIKQRRVKNKHLNLEAGGMVSDNQFVDVLESEEAKKAAKKKAEDDGRLAKRKEAAEDKAAEKLTKPGTSRKRKTLEEAVASKTVAKAKKSKKS